MIWLLVQLLGVALIIAGAAMVAPFLGLIVAGVFTLALGWAMDGVTNDGPSTAD